MYCNSTEWLLVQQPLSQLTHFAVFNAHPPLLGCRGEKKLFWGFLNFDVWQEGRLSIRTAFLFPPYSESPISIWTVLFILLRKISSPPAYPPSAHLGLFWREKNHQFFIPASADQISTCVNKTDKSKRYHLSFGGKALTDEISVWKLVGPNFNYGHQSIPLCLVCLAVVSVLSRKRSFAKSGLVVCVRTLPKHYLPTFCTRKYCSYRHKSMLCARGRIKTSRKKIQRLSLWKKNEIDLSQNGCFFKSGLSSSSFCSRQKDRWYLIYRIRTQ